MAILCQKTQRNSPVGTAKSLELNSSRWNQSLLLQGWSRNLIPKCVVKISITSKRVYLKEEIRRCKLLVVLKELN